MNILVFKCNKGLLIVLVKKFCYFLKGLGRNNIY